jgi:outer membrane lipoprotein LolB
MSAHPRSRAALAAVMFAGVLALAGCAVAPMRAPPPVVLSPAEHDAAMAAQAAHEAALALHPDWRLEGRVALTNNGRGGSGRLEWQQHGGDFSVELSAPVTRQGWRLSGREGDVVLEGLDGGPRRGTDAATLLREATGWEIPVGALASWVRGARAGVSAPTGGSRAELEFAADGRLIRLHQDGWTLDYADWQARPDGTVLPMRISASRDAARVRLVVDAWGDGSP